MSSGYEFTTRSDLRNAVDLWMSDELRKAGKLFRGQMNSQILSYLHFCDSTARFFSLSILSQFSQCNNITLRAGGLYESIEIVYDSYSLSKV